MTEEAERIAEGIREFLQDFPDLKQSDILRALQILEKNFEDAINWKILNGKFKEFDP
jgi:uncharacterized protein (DUF433 family)